MKNWFADRFDRAVRWRANEQIGVEAPLLVEERVRQPAAEMAWAVNELQRIVPQVAALEARIEDQRLSSPLESSPEVDREGTDVLAQIRAEHERVRARLFTVTRYVERLERLERRMDALEDRTMRAS